MSAMHQPTKDLLRDTLVAATDALIAERRKSEGWHHYANDTLASIPGIRKTAFRQGALAGVLGTLAAVLIGWLL